MKYKTGSYESDCLFLKINGNIIKRKGEEEFSLFQVFNNYYSIGVDGKYSLTDLQGE